MAIPRRFIIVAILLIVSISSFVAPASASPPAPLGFYCYAWAVTITNNDTRTVTVTNTFTAPAFVTVIDKETFNLAPGQTRTTRLVNWVPVGNGVNFVGLVTWRPIG